ncbi:unnamed protein product [Didymodactylos carnosus]|uniref:AMPK C-terminal adenylate sensor domain-containing protein n=1 Tax=Didymodactylos carnosus TaxID=1234261 RepID=A0A814EKG3_9BILA|nr:unnamed protein product [Didymodactylos carnosus]CAF0967491.1 unnamed protein product [Didymodactylos carnosus]CAF3618286.1 unnamed protein product [Didymodactylos carnosus]CAF3740872.1 unnamed protein product [Didymodactylos carnosus]
MPALKDLSVTLDPIESGKTSKNPALKKAKWHLGIRSQSKPQDIMNEVFKAMKELGMEWKYSNNSMYSLRARRKVPNSDRYVKLGLQLYQVDHRSYLLDFRNLNVNDQINHILIDQENDKGMNHQNVQWDFEGEDGCTPKFEKYSPVSPVTITLNNNQHQNSDSLFVEDGILASSPPMNAVSEVMEFFEMAASLIRTLAPDSAPKQQQQQLTTAASAVAGT